jgi:serine/threonine protein kinase
LLDASRENNPNFNTFLPPEIIKGYKVTTAVDIYQLGILFYYILYGTYPFQGEALAEKE